MSATEQFWIVIFFAVVIGVIAGHLIEKRRRQSIEEFERKRRDRKSEVEREARKAL